VGNTACVGTPVRIAAAGDIHGHEGVREHLAHAFAELADEVDLVLLAGDLTTCGEPEEAAVLADIVRGPAAQLPIFAVLGNHDWHANRTHEIVSILSDAGIRMLERSSVQIEVRGTSVGIVGLKGFVGGFPDWTLPDFGEPLLRQVYAETTADCQALERELGAIAECDLRLVLLHYSPTGTTLEGEPRAIWAFLGSDRLGRPIAEHRPDLVVHGHAHAGHFEGFVGSVPVYNVAVPVTRRDFWIFDLPGPAEEPKVERKVVEKPAV
jgi:uncharacterized protein